MTTRAPLPLASSAYPRRRPRGSSRGSVGRRGVTLIEILVVVALVAVVMGIAISSLSGSGSAQLRQASTRVAAAVRVAYARATAAGRVVRLVFDFGGSTIAMEETPDRHTIKKGSLSGDAADTAEDLARDAAGASAVRAPPATFEPVDLRRGAGVRTRDEEEAQDDDDKPTPVALPSKIQFWQIDVEHQPVPVRDGKAFLYFFPGGQTENASIQLRIAGLTEEDKTGFMTILVSPLTGKAKILGGRADAPKPLDESDASEVEDPGR